jgi:Raf kinase inhibitor-like YbhB/YbcL family protein
MEATVKGQVMHAGVRIAALSIALLASGCGSGSQGKAEAGAMKLASPALTEGAAVPVAYTCDGADRSPPLQWSDPPTGTRSFAMVVDDPDAPGGIFGHWGVWDIAGTRQGLEEGAGLPGAKDFKQATNGFGTVGYRGPCPPPGGGAHRYRFRLFALDTDRLNIGAGVGISQLKSAAQRHELASVTLTATYGR